MKIESAERDRPYEATAELTLTPYMEKRLIEVFNLEIEVMQGIREQLADGRARITITVRDEDKGELLRRFFLYCVANAEQKPGEN
jgi:hypothetical protein